MHLAPPVSSHLQLCRLIALLNTSASFCCRAMADLLVAVMQDAARRVARQQAGQAGQAQADQTEPQQAAQQETQPAQAGQQAQEQQRGQQAEQGGQVEQRQVQQAERQALPPVPDPMFPGNWESPNPTCRLGVSSLLALAVVVPCVACVRTCVGSRLWPFVGCSSKHPLVRQICMAILGNLLQASFKDAVAQADTFLFA